VKETHVRTKLIMMAFCGHICILLCYL